MAGETWRRRVLLVEDQPLMRALVAEALRTGGFDVHSCGSAVEAIDLFDSVDPDLLLADIDLGSRPNGIELSVIVRARAPHCAIVFLTNYPTTVSAADQVPAGASFISKSALDSVDGLVAVANAALADSQTTVTDQSGPEPHGLAALTRGQLDILRLIAEGWSNAEIARLRNCSLRAVEKSVTRTFDALRLNRNPSVNPRVAAAALYMRTFGVQAPVRDTPGLPPGLPAGHR